MLITVVLVLLAITGAAAAGAAWSLHAHGPLSGWLADHLPPWLIRWLMRLGEWLDSGETKRPMPARPAPPPVPAPRAPARDLPDLPPVPAVDTDVTGMALSPAQAAVVSETSAFEPGDDADLIAHFKREIAFQGAHADAFRSLLDTCLHAIGLDPSSVQGIGEYADVRADSAHDAAGMMHRFLTVYAEVREFVANGGVLPADGRWITGEGV